MLFEADAQEYIMARAHAMVRVAFEASSCAQAAQQLRDECHAFLLSQLPAEARAAAEVAAGNVPPQPQHGDDSMQTDSVGVPAHLPDADSAAVRRLQQAGARALIHRDSGGLITSL